MKKAVIFDMDGLMFDSERATYESYIQVCAEHGFTMRLPFYKTLLGLPMSRARGMLRQEFGEAFDVDLMVKKVQQRLQREFQEKGVPKKPGLMEVLDYVKQEGMPAMVATSSERERVEKILEMAGVDGYFQDIICGREVKEGKPAPDIFLTGCKKLGFAPSEVWILEDSEAGVAAAYHAGADCICVPDMKEPTEETRRMARYVVKTLTDARDVIAADRQEK